MLFTEQGRRFHPMNTVPDNHAPWQGLTLAGAGVEMEAFMLLPIPVQGGNDGKRRPKKGRRTVQVLTLSIKTIEGS